VKLIETDELIKAAKLNHFGGNSAARVLMMLLRINKINKLYEDISHLQGIEFLDSLIDKLQIDFEIREEEIKRIPLNGPFITVSNHPFGGIDGMLLVKILSRVRPDIKVLANFLMQRIDPVSDYILPVNPFEERKDVASSIAGLKMAFQHLQEGKPLGIFPAGEVSSYNEDNFGITDRQWQTPALKMIRKAAVPIVPIYFQGTNSRIFHLLGLIHPSLRTVKLPSELLNKKNRTIRVRIGNPISVKEQEAITDIDRYGRFLRAKTYALGSAIEVKKFFNPTIHRSTKVEPIIEAAKTEDILCEIDRIKSDYLLFSSSNFDVYCTPSVEIPVIMNEIGRLREITFRGVGEGTNRSLDIDEYDLYYHQLFVWDNEENKIVGAYRVGKGKDIIRRYGIKGFYIQSLFRISKKFVPVMNEALELGRSFVVAEYQKKPMPLFLLWKGILYFLIKHSEYRYLIGPVSISNQFSEFSKGMIIKYIKEHHYNNELARFIKPRTRFNVKGFNIDEDIIIESADDLNKFDRFIKDVEPSDYTMPVLLKKYLKLNGQIVCFNLDPKFNNALDGLLVLDLFDVPMDSISSLAKEINDDKLLDRFDIEKLS